MAESKQSATPGREPKEPGSPRPPTDGHPAESRQTLEGAATSGGRALRVLVVDDDPNLGESLRDVLTEKGYELVVVNDGEKALALLREEQFDMALVDIRMPGLDGATTARFIHSLAPELPVAMITGYAFDELARQTLREGAVAVLGKPLDIDHLVKLIERTVKRPTVLIVDGDQPEAEELRGTLESARCLSVIAPNLAAARQALTQSTFDVIVLDSALVREHGPDSLVEVTRLRPGAYLVFLASRAPTSRAPAATEAASADQASADAAQRTLEVQVRHAAFAVLEEQPTAGAVLGVIDRIRKRMKERYR
jgi:DNA-binding NtrC family response regulator